MIKGTRQTKKTALSTPARITYEVKELNSTTWPDFEKFFAKHNGVQGGCWCTLYHHAVGRMLKEGLERKDAIALNRKEKKSRVKQGRSHGILVYSDDQAVGWCQYGPKKSCHELIPAATRANWIYKTIREGNSGASPASSSTETSGERA